MSGVLQWHQFHQLTSFLVLSLHGLKNINLVLNTQNYTRFRFGISDEFKKGKQVDYVLGEWDDAEKLALSERLELASEIIKSFGTAGLENTMTTFNGK